MLNQNLIQEGLTDILSNNILQCYCMQALHGAKRNNDRGFMTASEDFCIHPNYSTSLYSMKVSFHLTFYFQLFIDYTLLYHEYGYFIHVR